MRYIYDDGTITEKHCDGPTNDTRDWIRYERLNVGYQGESDREYDAFGKGTVTWYDLDNSKWTGTFLEDKFIGANGVFTLSDGKEFQFSLP